MTFFILATLVWPSVLWCQNDTRDSRPGLTASLDRDAAEVGSMVVLTIDYRLPEEARLPTDPEIKGLEEMTPLDRQIGPDNIKIRIMVDKLDTWRSGPISLKYLDKEGNLQALETGPVFISVLSNLEEDPDETTLRPILGIIPTKSPNLTHVLWGVGLFGIAFVLVLGLIWRYRLGRPQQRSPARQDPPHVIAIRDIEELEAKELFEKGHIKAFYFRFSEILRQYLEAIRGFPAAEYTTEEIAASIREEKDQTLVPVLQQADLVKFADAMPSAVRKEQEVEWAISYIRATSQDAETDHSTDGPQE